MSIADLKATLDLLSEQINATPTPGAVDRYRRMHGWLFREYDHRRRQRESMTPSAPDDVAEAEILKTTICPRCKAATGVPERHEVYCRLNAEEGT